MTLIRRRNQVSQLPILLVCTFLGLVACGSSIYNIGESIFISNSPSSSVDCTSHTWHEGPSLRMGQRSISYCEIENVLYCGYYGVLICYDTEVRKWRKLNGLVGLPRFPDDARVRLANYGGKMAVFWDNTLPYCHLFNEKSIWCAEIALERPKSYEIWGKVEWFDRVLKVGSYDQLVKVIAATV